jgi:hypothetical protein
MAAIRAVLIKTAPFWTVFVQAAQIRAALKTVLIRAIFEKRLKLELF